MPNINVIAKFLSFYFSILYFPYVFSDNYSYYHHDRHPDLDGSSHSEVIVQCSRVPLSFVSRVGPAASMAPVSSVSIDVATDAPVGGYSAKGRSSGQSESRSALITLPIETPSN